MILIIFLGAYLLGRVLYPMPTRNEPPRFNRRWYDRNHIQPSPISEKEKVA
jgi:hypothetical protein